MAAYPPPATEGYPPGKDGAYPPPQNPAYPPSQPYPAQAPPAYQPTPQPQQTAQATTVVVTQPVVTVTTPTFRDYPVTVTDSNGQQVQTVLEYHSGLLTYLACALVCLFLMEIGLCWLGLIPFCISATKDVYHITPTDGKVVGVYKRLS